MTKPWRWLLAALFVLSCLGLALLLLHDRRPRARETAAVRRAMEALRPLHTPPQPPQPFEWLATYREPGQTFTQYLASHPVVPDAKRRVIYVQPLGDFTDGQREVVAATAEYLHALFDLPVKVRPNLPLSLVGADARRHLPAMDEQVHTGFVMRRILRPRLPADALAMVAFTATDLWPGPAMNFVFGEASLRDRVGVWSLHRLAEPSGGGTDADRRLFLLRTLKIAAHETGHMISILHCTKYECGMAGSNSLWETDRHPLAFCPECMAKVCWATRQDPKEHYRRLAAFCRSHGLAEELDFCYASLRKLEL